MKTTSTCSAFHLFQHWQLQRLEPAIAEGRLYLSEQLQRTISFAEAESDFFGHNGYGCLERWRAEYCSGLCPNRGSCPLANGFIAQAHAA